MATTVDSEQVKAAVRETYGRIATEERSAGCCGSTGCCGPGAEPTSDALGYSDEERRGAPEGADLGLGCGNPQAIAELKSGERVLDLGSGAGFDAFLAARQVGETGSVIGVDMTAEMIAKARGEHREDRPAERRVPARRDRASASRRCQRGRDHVQLRDQPVDRQGSSLPRGVPRARARRTSGHLGHRRDSGDSRGRTQRPRGLCRLRVRCRTRSRRRSAACRSGVQGCAHRAQGQQCVTRGGMVSWSRVPGCLRSHSCDEAADERHGKVTRRSGTHLIPFFRSVKS